MGTLAPSLIAPWTKVFVTGFDPNGSDQAASEIVNKLWPQLAALLESGTDALGMTDPRLISRYVDYEMPRELLPEAAKYANELAGAGRYLSGMAEDMLEFSKDELKRELVNAIKEQAIEKTVRTALIGSIPNIGPIIDAVKVVVANREALKTPEGVVSTAVSVGVGFAGCSLGVSLVISTAVSLAMGFFGAQKAKEEMRKEKERAEAFARMVNGFIDVAVAEATALAEAVVTRGFPLREQPDSGWSQKLATHYETLVLNNKKDHNWLWTSQGETFWKYLAAESRGALEDWRDSLLLANSLGRPWLVEGWLQVGKINYTGYKPAWPANTTEQVKQQKIAAGVQTINREYEAALAQMNALISWLRLPEKQRGPKPPVYKIPTDYKSSGTWTVSNRNIVEYKIAEMRATWIVDIKIGRNDRLRYLLQFARDMRKVRLALEQQAPVTGTKTKDANTVASETITIKDEVLAINPDVPVQVALNVASDISRGTAAPITGEQGEVIAQKVAQQAQQAGASTTTPATPTAVKAAFGSAIGITSLALVAKAVMAYASK